VLEAYRLRRTSVLTSMASSPDVFSPFFLLAIYSAGGQDKVIVNLRCLEGLDVDALEIQTFDGKSY
jgi:hypothetical protein